MRHWDGVALIAECFAIVAVIAGFEILHCQGGMILDEITPMGGRFSGLMAAYAKVARMAGIAGRCPGSHKPLVLLQPVPGMMRDGNAFLMAVAAELLLMAFLAPPGITLCVPVMGELPACRVLGELHVTIGAKVLLMTIFTLTVGFAGCFHMVSQPVCGMLSFCLMAGSAELLLVTLRAVCLGCLRWLDVTGGSPSHRMRRDGLVAAVAEFRKMTALAGILSVALHIVFMSLYPLTVKSRPGTLQISDMAYAAIIGGLLPIVTFEARCHGGRIHKRRTGTMDKLRMTEHAFDAHLPVRPVGYLQSVVDNQLTGFFMALPAVCIGNVPGDLLRVNSLYMGVKLFQSLEFRSHHAPDARRHVAFDAGHIFMG